MRSIVQQLFAVASLAGVAFLGGCAAAPVLNAAPGVSPLRNDDQLQLESEALRVLQSPAVAAARVAGVRAIEAQVGAADHDAIVGAVDELAFGAAESVVDADPARPRVFNTWNPPHESFGRLLPGAKAVIPNPDTVFRIIPIDDASSYVIEGHPTGAPPSQQVFMLQNGLNGYGKGMQVSALRLASDFVKGPDGSFTLKIDPNSDDGSGNHIRSLPGTHYLLMRDTLGDWSTQLPYALTVERVAGPPLQAAVDESQLDTEAAALLGDLVPAYLHSRAGFFVPQANTLPEPGVREGGRWALSTGGHFKLADDEALVITLRPLGAKYLAVQLADTWTRALDYAHRTASLNNTQALANADGSYTLVVAPRDPGVRNWVDTCSLHEGVMFLRWQNLPDQYDANTAVQDVRVVRFAELTSVLAPGSPTVDSAARKQQLDARASDYSRRFGY